MPNPLVDKMPPLARWFGEQKNNPLLIAEKACCMLLLGHSVAGHAVQFDLSTDAPEFLSTSPAIFQHRIQVGDDGSLHGACHGRGDELPLASNSVQLLVSHHSHEVGEQLDVRLSELSRVLNANGTIVLVGFNALGRACEAPLDGIQCLRPDQLARKLRGVGLVPQRSRAVLLPAQNRFDRVLDRMQHGWPLSESWVAGLAVAYVMSARKVDNGAINRNFKHLQLKHIKRGVQGTATG